MKTISKKFMKVAIPLTIVWGIIMLAKSGYDFGHWLFVITH